MLYNNVTFRGQYQCNLIKLLQGEEITVQDFNNGGYVATTPYRSFINRLDKAGIKYDSWHTTNRKNKGYSSLVIKLRYIDTDGIREFKCFIRR